jgi:hypothetical protein
MCEKHDHTMTVTISGGTTLERDSAFYVLRDALESRVGCEITVCPEFEKAYQERQKDRLALSVTETVKMVVKDHCCDHH